MKQHMAGIPCHHIKDIDPAVKTDTITNRTNFYEACNNDILFNLGKGEMNFKAILQLLEEASFDSCARSSSVVIHDCKCLPWTIPAVTVNSWNPPGSSKTQGESTGHDSGVRSQRSAKLGRHSPDITSIRPESAYP